MVNVIFCLLFYPDNIEDQTYFKHIDRKQAEIILKQLENPQVSFIAKIFSIILLIFYTE